MHAGGDEAVRGRPLSWGGLDLSPSSQFAAYLVSQGSTEDRTGPEITGRHGAITRYDETRRVLPQKMQGREE